MKVVDTIVDGQRAVVSPGGVSLVFEWGDYTCRNVDPPADLEDEGAIESVVREAMAEWEGFCEGMKEVGA